MTAELAYGIRKDYKKAFIIFVYNCFICFIIIVDIINLMKYSDIFSASQSFNLLFGYLYILRITFPFMYLFLVECEFSSLTQLLMLLSY